MKRFELSGTEVCVAGRRWLIVPRRHLRGDPTARIVQGHEASSLASSWFDDVNALGAMVDLYEELTGALLRAPSTLHLEHEIIPTLLRALQDGDLVILQRPFFDEPAKREDRPIQKKEADPPVPPKGPRIGRVIKEKTFLDVTITDEEGNRLVNSRYKLQLPNGLTEQGRLDSSARLFRPNIDPGSARLFILPDEQGGVDAEHIVPHGQGPDQDPNFVVRLVDEIGESVEGVEITFEHGGTPDQATTDGDGRAGIADLAAPEAVVRFADPDALREAVRARWDGVRDGEIMDDSDDLAVVELHGELRPITVRPDALKTISIQPYVARGRLVGGFFDTSKCFLLPSGLDGVRAIVEMYGDNPDAKLLIVGHTDTAGTPAYNDPLSLERAESLKDYLTDNVAGWLKWYDPNSIPAEKRWGTKEDEAMAAELRRVEQDSDEKDSEDEDDRADAESAVRWFRRTRNITPVKDSADRATRKALITEYMRLDGTSLPGGVEVTTHGCGENFPSDQEPDGMADAENRRVEVFFFDGKLGIQPPPPGKNSAQSSPEYPEWVKRARRTASFRPHTTSDGYPFSI